MNAISSGNFPISIIFFYFLYGLAFFSMGLAMVLEIRRDPLIAGPRVLIPFAAFFFLNGFFNWVEMWLFSLSWAGFQFIFIFIWFRFLLLVTSFSCLLIFGVRALHPLEKAPRRVEKFVGMGLLGLYGLFIFLWVVWQKDSPDKTIENIMVITRYCLGIPGSLVAAAALWRQSQGTVALSNRQLDLFLKIVAVCMALFGISQLLVISNPIFSLDHLSIVIKNHNSGLYILLVRTLLGIVMSLGLICVSQLVEEERQRLFEAVRQARVEALRAIENEMVEREAMRQELLRHIVLAQEEERSRIARELHDDTAQFLTAFSLNLATIQNLIPENKKVHAILENLQDLSKSMSQGIHRMVYDLRPAQLDDLGLVAALQSLSDDSRRNGLDVRFETEGQIQRLDSLVETVIFRIAQEALTNVSKHAQSQRITLQLKTNSEQITLHVRDYGIGFDANRKQFGNQCWGLIGMRERAESVGGLFKVYSAIGEGTLVEVIIPFKNTSHMGNRRFSLDERN